MKDSLVLASLLHRLGRTLATILGISLAVSLVNLMVGLAHGQILSRGKRESAVGAEIIAAPSGYFTLGPTTSPLMLRTSVGDELRYVDGVRSFTPLGQFVEGGSGGIGFRLIEGIDFSSYVAMTPLDFAAGGPITDPDEAIIDSVFAGANRLRVGGSIQALGQRFRISGIYRKESGARIKIGLRRMQELTGQAERCSVFLIKCKDPDGQIEVAKRLQAAFPEFQFLLLRDLPSYYVNHMPASLKTFLNVVVLVAVVISVLVVLLTLYTSVHERTREIGILKSLGASKTYILAVFEQEALVMGIFGVLIGFVLSYVTAHILGAATELVIQFESRWLIIGSGIGLTSAVVGGFYPAMRAASQDPVEALSYE